MSHVPDQIPLPALFSPLPPLGWRKAGPCVVSHVPDRLSNWWSFPCPPSLPHPLLVLLLYQIRSPYPYPASTPSPPPLRSPPPHPTPGWMRAGPCVVSHVPDRLSNWWSCLPSVREVMTAANTTPLHSTLDWWSQPTHTRAFLTANISNFVILGWCLSSCVLDGHSSPESVFYERRYLQLDAPEKKLHLFILFCHAYCTNRLINPICCLWLIWPIEYDAKNLKNDRNHIKWVLIWEYSARAIQWIRTWQGFWLLSKIFAFLCFGQKLPLHWKG